MRFATTSQESASGRDSAAKLNRTRIYTDDLDEIRDWERSQGIESERRQLSRGVGGYETDFFDLESLFAWRYREPHRLLHEFALPAGTIEICFAKFAGSLTWRGRSFQGSMAAIHRGGDVYDGVVPQGCVIYGFVFPEGAEVVRTLLSQDSMTLDFEPQSIPASVIEPVFRSLDQRLLGSDCYIDADSAARLMLDACYRLTSSCLPCDADPSLSARKRLVDDARDLMKLGLDDSLTVMDIAQELQVTRRTLERAFRVQLGITPYQFLLVERLHEARRMLKIGDRSVLDCCQRSGFDDASRFSMMYLRHFGESPSETRVRHR